MKIDAQLLVWLKGTDLSASTAFLTLTDKMGFAGRLGGIKRFDYFRLALESAGGGALQAPAAEVVTALKGALDRQSTFYNRNKHAYMLECSWGDGRHREGPSRGELQTRWATEISKYLQHKQLTNFGGKTPPDGDILNEFKGFLAEVLVEDEDPSARDSVAAKLHGGLGGTAVSCTHRGTLWWLALRVPTRDVAETLSREMVVTSRRDSGLLMNPNYQSAEFVAVKEF